MKRPERWPRKPDSAFSQMLFVMHSLDAHIHSALDDTATQQQRRRVCRMIAYAFPSLAKNSPHFSEEILGALMSTVLIVRLNCRLELDQYKQRFRRRRSTTTTCKISVNSSWKRAESIRGASTIQFRLRKSAQVNFGRKSLSYVMPNAVTTRSAAYTPAPIRMLWCRSLSSYTIKHPLNKTVLISQHCLQTKSLHSALVTSTITNAFSVREKRTKNCIKMLAKAAIFLLCCVVTNAHYDAVVWSTVPGYQ